MSTPSGAGLPGIRESALLDPVTMEILSTAYLLRPPDEAALVAALADPPRDLRARIAALEDGGFLRRDGEPLEYESPYTVFVALGEARARALMAENARTVALMEALPGLIRAWDLGTADPEGEHPLAVTLVHAHADSWDEWFRHAERERPQRPSLVAPDAGVLRVALVSGHLLRLQERLSGEARVRVLVPSDPTWGRGGDGVADLDGLVEAARAAGVDFRRSEQVASWMYVDPPGLAALPVWWGSPAPENTIAIRTPPVVAAIGLLFDELWATSHAWLADDEPWADVLGLLARGLTDDAVARTLGITARTVRRRVSEAMAELGASSRFTLGMAWRRRT
ncbi:helix-turn-helix domain-containing protein [Nocardioides humi]|uniref:HTH luxR-type domain-containing protein n=1 Tax=Nocardioides humi TaxID=449461 RepID=A0ABN2AKL6_9ACTN|nr:helix-turn-helix transcriptional regulator [Nocardioides humi]